MSNSSRLLNKVRNVNHYLNLKFYIELWLKLTKIHRVIQFQQYRWLQPNIAKNTYLRIAAKSEMEKAFYKLMNNSIYGKTCENQAKHTDIPLRTDTEKCERLSCKSQCQVIRIFNDHLVGLNMKKVTITINKPFYAGFVVLELSKPHMFKYVAILIGSLCHCYSSHIGSILFGPDHSIVPLSYVS